MKYKVYILPEAAADLQRLAKSEPKAFVYVDVLAAYGHYDDK